MGVILVIIIFAAVLGLYIYISKRDNKDERDYFSRDDLIKYENEILVFKEKYGLGDCADVDRVLKALNCTVVLKNIGLIKEAETHDKKIVLNTRLNEKSKTFALWHEIAHILQGETSPVARTVHSLKRRPISEQKCDYYAAALILPQDDLLQRLKESNYKSKTRSEKELFVKDLADEKNVYKEVVERRIEEVLCMNNL